MLVQRAPPVRVIGSVATDARVFTLLPNDSNTFLEPRLPQLVRPVREPAAFVRAHAPFEPRTGPDLVGQALVPKVSPFSAPEAYYVLSVRVDESRDNARVAHDVHLVVRAWCHLVHSDHRCFYSVKKENHFDVGRCRKTNKGVHDVERRF